MALTKEQKTKVIADYATKEGDTGSTEVQIALLTFEINSLNEHLTAHKHDNHSRRGLYTKIGQRRSMINYLRNQSNDRYQALIKKLGLRR